MPYVHLSESERQEIARLRHSGISVTAIGKELGRSPGTISRELRRNACKNGRYYCCYAEREALKRRRNAKRHQPKKIDSGKLLSYVKAKLKQQWSPEQIAGRMREDYEDDLSKRISHPSIYAWLKEDKSQGGEFHKHLRQSHRQRRKKYGSSPKKFKVEGKVSIEDRPKVVEKRSRLGDWEGDLMEGKDRTSYLVTLVERRSRYLLCMRIKNKQAATVRKATISLMKKVPSSLRKTLTFDNGSEFADFARMESALEIKVYFAHPYASWERGTNENTNGLLRQYVPKRSDFRRKSHQELAKLVHRLNNRPRKTLKYQTPREVLHT